MYKPYFNKNKSDTNHHNMNEDHKRTMKTKIKITTKMDILTTLIIRQTIFI